MTTNRECSKLIAKREPFHNSTRSLTGATYSLGKTGKLRNPELERFYSDVNDIVYVVYSYDTPIWWELSDGSKYRVKQKFSATTSRHSGLCPIGDNEK